MSGVYDGLTVVELADRRNQWAGKLLADGGARVIQIEPPAGGPGRWCGPFVDDKVDPDRCLDYWWYNTGKQSVALDIGRQPAQDLLRRLVARADIFLALGSSSPPERQRVQPLLASRSAGPGPPRPHPDGRLDRTARRRSSRDRMPAERQRPVTNRGRRRHGWACHKPRQLRACGERTEGGARSARSASDVSLERIASSTRRSSMMAIKRRRPPQRGQASTSISNARRMRSAHAQ